MMVARLWLLAGDARLSGLKESFHLFAELEQVS